MLELVILMTKAFPDEHVEAPLPPVIVIPPDDSTVPEEPPPPEVEIPEVWVPIIPEEVEVVDVTPMPEELPLEIPRAPTLMMAAGFRLRAAPVEYIVSDPGSVHLNNTNAEALIQDGRTLRLAKATAEYLVQDERTVSVRVANAEYLSLEEKNCRVKTAVAEMLLRDGESNHIRDVTSEYIAQDNINRYAIAKHDLSYMTYDTTRMDIGSLGGKYVISDGAFAEINQCLIQYLVRDDVEENLGNQ